MKQKQKSTQEGQRHHKAGESWSPDHNSINYPLNSPSPDKKSANVILSTRSPDISDLKRASTPSRYDVASSWYSQPEQAREHPFTLQTPIKSDNSALKNEETLASHKFTAAHPQASDEVQHFSPASNSRVKSTKI
jgi:hypothetical protein